MNFSPAATLHPPGSGALFTRIKPQSANPTVKCEKSFVTDGRPLVWVCAASCLSVCICVCECKESRHDFKDKWEWCPLWQKLLSRRGRVSFLLPEGRLYQLWDLQRFEHDDELISLKRWSWQMAFPRLHTLLQSCPTLSGWWCGGTGTHTRGHGCAQTSEASASHSSVISKGLSDRTSPSLWRCIGVDLADSVRALCSE